MSLSFLLGVVAAIVYWIRGVWLTERAMPYLRNRGTEHYWAPPILRPELFHPEGESARARAVAFWNRGALILLLYFIVVFVFG
jgi:hypothetical protein